jgi:formylglycine-generating enzyme required for sulfatase activity
VLLKSKNLIAKNEIVRLPTEAEWEYCCRAGTTTRYSFGDSAATEEDKSPKATILNEYAWHTGNAAGNDPVVGSLKPNPWGLYDMHGYLWEFVSDPFSPSADGSQSIPKAESEPAQNDSVATDKSPARIIRGGSWRDEYAMLTSACRLTLPDHAASDAIGIRCVIAEVLQGQ